MRRQTAAVWLVLVMLGSTACAPGQQTLQVTRDQLPQAVEDGRIEARNEGGGKSKLRVRSVEVQTESVDSAFAPEPYEFGPGPIFEQRPPFPTVVDQWKTSSEWRVADVTVDVPKSQGGVYLGALLGGVTAVGVSLFVIDGESSILPLYPFLLGTIVGGAIGGAVQSPPTYEYVE